jgi:hypothetical protein
MYKIPLIPATVYICEALLTFNLFHPHNKLGLRAQLKKSLIYTLFLGSDAFEAIFSGERKKKIIIISRQTRQETSSNRFTHRIHLLVITLFLPKHPSDGKREKKKEKIIIYF